MNLKRIFIFSLLCAFSFSLISCKKEKTDEKTKESIEETTEGITTDETLETTKEEVSYLRKRKKLHNLGYSYQLESDYLDAYFFQGSSTCYVGINAFLKAIDGYLDYSTYEVILKDNYLKINQDDRYFMVNYNEDTVVSNALNFFYTTLESSSDYDFSFLNYTGEEDFSESEPLVTYDLNKYGFKAIRVNDDICLPVSFLQVILSCDSYLELIYNQKEFYFYDGMLDNETYMETINPELMGKEMPLELRRERLNQLCFAYDYFYGLKDNFATNDLKAYLKEEKSIYDLLMSKDSEVSEEGLIKLILQGFNEPHSSLGYKSYYSKVRSVDDAQIEWYYEDCGPRVKTFYDTYYELSALYDKTFKDYQIVRFKDNTAFIHFDVFERLANSELTSEDAYLTDTKLLMEKAFAEIKKHQEVKNIVIDLSTNLGGVVNAGYLVCGYLTNKDLKTANHYQNLNAKSLISIAIDVNGDGNFSDNDAYTNYNYALLTSEASFSCATLVTQIIKDNKSAKIIGKNPSGGACSVADVLLIDGTTFQISGNEHGYGYREETKEFWDVEFGVQVDYEIEHNKMYDLTYVSNFVNNLYR